MPYSQPSTIEKLIELSRKGRSIVPLLGAGISIEAGIPSLSELTRYLAKVQLYIRERLYRPREDRQERSAGVKEPSEYLRDFGWPEPNQLESDLWLWLATEGATRRGYGKNPQVWMDRLVQDELITHFERLDEGLAEGLKSLQRGLFEIEERASGKAPKGRDKGTRSKRWHEMVELWRTLHKTEGEALPRLLATPSWNLRGDYWKHLLSHLTRSNPDYVDTLFQQLVQNREPGTAHRYLAFLTRILRIRVFLTTNFDSLLEDALRMEGLHPIVYEALEGYPLPHPSLVHKEISVIKLHGGAFGLRVGEQLNRPLDQESRARLKSYLPQNPVLLVMGLGGWDLRVLDMVELAHEKRGTVFWLRFEPNAPQPVKDRFYETSAAGEEPRPPEWFWGTRLRDPGAFLKELFIHRTGAHPASSHPYRAYDQRPIPGNISSNTDDFPESAAVRIFVDKEEDEPVESGSRRLAEFVAHKAETHSPVWIDLESKSTVDDIVVDIMLQLRRYDSSLPPEVHTVESSVGADGRYDKVIRRMFQTLQRGRYILAFDGVGSFGRPPLQHHGLPVERKPKRTQRNVQPGSDFLLQLIKEARTSAERAIDQRSGIDPVGLGNSILAFSVDLQRLRTEDKQQEPPFWNGLRKFKRKLSLTPDFKWLLAERDLQRRPERGKLLCKEKLKNTVESEAWEGYWDGCTLLCAFRRRRSMVALHRLLPKYLHPSEAPAQRIGEAMNRAESPPVRNRSEVEAFLQWCLDQKLMIRVEGGYYSIARRVRDALYVEAQDRTRSEDLLSDSERRFRRKLTKKRESILNELATLAAIHGDIAVYYQELYTASREVPALLEHLYHRVSALRYLTKLDAWSPAVEGISLPNSLRRRLQKLFPPREMAADGETSPRGHGAVPLTDQGCINRVTLRKRRLQMSTALCGTLWRQRDRLLAGVPSVTLLEWTQDLRDQMRRFNVETALKRGARPFHRPPGPSSATRRQPNLQLLVRLEKATWKILGDLRRELDHIEATVHEDRLDIQGVVEVRAPWLERLIGLSPGRTASAENLLEEPKQYPECIRERPWLVDPEAWKRQLGLGERPRKKTYDVYQDPRLLEIQRSLFQIANTLRKNNHHAPSDKLSEIMSLLPSGDWSTADSDAEAEYARVYHLLHAADHKLSAFNPWESKGRPERFHRQCIEAGTAVQICEEALEMLEWLPEEDRNLRSYLHSLKGRAHYLRLQFEQAFPEFDLAHAALSNTKGRGSWEGRAEARAVASMRHAEALMLRADDKIIEWCCRAVKLATCSDAVESETRLSLSYWETLELRSLDGWISSGQNEDSDFDRVEPFIDTITGAWQRLSSAWDLLALAERHLDEARRNLEWRAWLSQLRAQLHVEQLLLQITGGFPVELGTARPSSSARSSHKGGGEQNDASTGARKGRQIGALVNDLRQGLRAIRQGLDIILPDVTVRDEKTLEKDPRLHHLLRLWRELMVCGAYRTRVIGTESSDALEPEKLWQRWSTLNALEGLRRLPRAEEGQLWLALMDKEGKLPRQRGEAGPGEEMINEPFDTQLAHRKHALSLIKESMNKKLLDSLITVLCDREPKLGGGV